MMRKKKTMAKRKRKMSRIKVRMMEIGESRRTMSIVVVVGVVIVCVGPSMCWVARYEEFGCCCCCCSVLAKQWP